MNILSGSLFSGSKNESRIRSGCRSFVADRVQLAKAVGNRGESVCRESLLKQHHFDFHSGNKEPISEKDDRKRLRFTRIFQVHLRFIYIFSSRSNGLLTVHHFAEIYFSVLYYGLPGRFLDFVSFLFWIIIIASETVKDPLRIEKEKKYCAEKKIIKVE